MTIGPAYHWSVEFERRAIERAAQARRVATGAAARGASALDDVLPRWAEMVSAAEGRFIFDDAERCIAGQLGRQLPALPFDASPFDVTMQLLGCRDDVDRQAWLGFVALWGLDGSNTEILARDWVDEVTTRQEAAAIRARSAPNEEETHG